MALTLNNHEVEWHYKLKMASPSQKIMYNVRLDSVCACLFFCLDSMYSTVRTSHQLSSTKSIQCIYITSHVYRNITKRISTQLSDSLNSRFSLSSPGREISNARLSLIMCTTRATTKQIKCALWKIKWILRWCTQRFDKKECATIERT